MNRTATCAGCRQPIEWRVTPNEKNMPLDAEPIDQYQPGAYVLDENGTHCRPGEPLLDPPGTIFHLNHWASCPVASTFKPMKGSTR